MIVKITQFPVFVLTPGTSLFLRSDTMVVVGVDGGKSVLPLRKCKSLVVVRGVSLSVDLMWALLDLKASVSFISGAGRLLGVMSGSDSGRGNLRERQYHLGFNRRLEVSKRLVAAKVSNYYYFMENFYKNHGGVKLKRGLDKTLLLSEGISGVSDFARLMQIEGACASVFFQLSPVFVSGSVGGRSRFPSFDAYNAFISIGYGLLKNSYVSALGHYRLDSDAGVMHTISADKPSLALDLMEESRYLVDRCVIGLLNNRQLRSDVHYSIDDVNGCVVNEFGFKTFVQLYSSFLQKENVKCGGAKVTLLEVPYRQVLLFSRYLRDDSEYVPWCPRGLICSV